MYVCEYMYIYKQRERERARDGYVGTQVYLVAPVPFGLLAFVACVSVCGLLIAHGPCKA